MSVAPRMHRLFASDGRCLVVALDHGMFHEPSFLLGLENISRVVNRLVHTLPDALQLTPGQAALLQQIAGPRKPALVLRVDTTNVYTRPTASTLFSVLVEQAVEQAVAMDAAAIVVNLLTVPGSEQLHATCLRHIAKLRPECDRFGMPLMVEPLVLLPAPNGRVLESSLNAHAIASLTRQAVEMGADLIKADPCDDPDEFAQIVEAASGRPVLVRGGATVNTDSLVKRTVALLDRGARGLVFGRNILQAANPEQLVATLMHALHGSTMERRASGERSARPEPPAFDELDSSDVGVPVYAPGIASETVPAGISPTLPEPTMNQIAHPASAVASAQSSPRPAAPPVVPVLPPAMPVSPPHAPPPPPSTSGDA